jgi:hypothetical protein
MEKEKQQTAVDIAFEKLANQGLLVTRDYKNLVVYREAKEMQQEQAQLYAEFCVMCDRENLPLLDFESYILTNGGNK